MVLEKFGIDPNKDLQLIELDMGSHLSALESHTVDALFTYEPTATQAVMEKGAVKIMPGAVESQIISPWQAGVWVVDQRFSNAHPAVTDAVITALYEAVDLIRADPGSEKKALGPYTSIKPEVAAATPNIPFAKLGEVDLTALQKHADILFERKVISKHIDATSLLLTRAGSRGGG
jgi:ABC-type nitrate/sulfonate/bicarbonate transport system substrate-binding protein